MEIQISEIIEKEPEYLYLEEYCDKYNLKMKIEIIKNKYHNHNKYLVYLISSKNKNKSSLEKVYMVNSFGERMDVYGISFNSIQDAVLSLVGYISLKNDDKKIYLVNKLLDFDNLRTDLSLDLREKLRIY